MGIGKGKMEIGRRENKEGKREDAERVGVRRGAGMERLIHSEW